MLETMELGPYLNQRVASFCLPDSRKKMQDLDNLMGKNGILLGFIGNIWHVTSVRRILWLQHHLHKFALMGTPVALLIQEHPNTIYGFQMSSPLPVPFPMLADEDGAVHKQYRMANHPGLLLVNREGILHHKWLMSPDRVWPKQNEIAIFIHSMERSHA
jgi:peroxiredoxin